MLRLQKCKVANITVPRSYLFVQIIMLRYGQILPLVAPFSFTSIRAIPFKRIWEGWKTFFQTLPPSFYIFRLDPPSLITQLCVGPPSLRIFYGFRLYF